MMNGFDNLDSRDETKVPREEDMDQREISLLLAATRPEVGKSFQEQLDARLMAALEKKRSIPQQLAEPARRKPTYPTQEQTPPLASIRSGRLRWVGSTAMGLVGIVLLILLFVGMAALLRARQQSPGTPLQSGVVPVTVTPAVPDASEQKFASSLQPVVRWRTDLISSNSIAWSPDGETLATASSSQVTTWNAFTGKVMATTMPEGSKIITGIAWSPYLTTFSLAERFFDLSGKAGPNEGFISFLNPGTLRALKSVSQRNRVLSMAWSPDGGTLATTDGWQITMWDASTGTAVPQAVPTWPAPVTGQPAPNAFTIYTVSNLAWFPGQPLATSQNNIIKLWDPKSEKELASFQTPGRVLKMVWSPGVYEPGGYDLAVIAEATADESSNPGQVIVLSGPQPDKQLLKLGPFSEVDSIAWSSYKENGLAVYRNTLAVGISSKGPDKDYVALYDATTGKVLRKISGAATDLAWSPDGQTLAVADSLNGMVTLLRVSSGPTPTAWPTEDATQVPTPITPIPLQSPVPTSPVGIPTGSLGQGQRSSAPQRIEMVDVNVGWGLTHDGDQRGISLPYLTRTLLRTTDGGSNWRNATPPNLASGSVILDMHFLDANRGWLATIDQQQQAPDVAMAVALYRTTDAGQTWNSAIVPFAYRFATPYPSVSLDFLDSNRGWMTIYGPGGMSTTPGQLFTTTDGGATWTEIANTANIGGQLSGQTLSTGQLPFGGDIHFHNASTGWLVGSMAGTDVHHLYITQDGGRSWQEQALKAANSIQPQDRINVLEPPVFFSDSEGVVAAMEIPDSQEAAKFSAGVFITSDGGRTWKEATSVPATDPAAFTFLSSQNWWVWGSAPRDTNSTATVQGKLYRTSSGDQAWNANGSGVKWNVLTLGPGDALTGVLQSGYDVTQLDFVSVNVGWAILVPLVGDAARPYILLKTVDGGQTWKIPGQK